MEKCQKCGGMMLLMKTKKSVMPNTDKKQGWKCSRCGNYFEKQQSFTNTFEEPSDEPYYLRRRT